MKTGSLAAPIIAEGPRFTPVSSPPVNGRNNGRLDSCVTGAVAISRRNLIATAGVAVILPLVLFSLPIAVEPRIKQRLVNALGERFDSEVQLETLTVSLLPSLRLSGRGLVLRHKHRTDGPPLVMIASFSGDASLVGLLSDPVKISNIRLEGLEINVPPGGLSLNDDEPDGRSKSDQPDQSGKSVTSGGQDQHTDADDNDTETSPLIVGNLHSERAVLRIFRREPGKAPRVWEIGQLDMKDVGANHPWPFRANLTNPTPPGRIQTEGTFGPWQAEEPSQTPLAASYRFENADLGVFDGIAGILNSSGAFKGVLERIEVDGTTSMPAFAPRTSGTACRSKRGSTQSWTAQTATRCCSLWTPPWAPRRCTRKAAWSNVKAKTGARWSSTSSSTPGGWRTFSVSQ